MKKLSLLFGILIAVLAAGCTQHSVPVVSSRKAAQEQPAAQPAQPRIEPVIAPEKVETAAVQASIEELPEPEPAIEEENATAPSHTFSEAETAHVRSATYDPFPEGKDKFSINLSEICDEFCYPHPGKLISAYGMRGRRMHSGSDIKGALGDTIRSAFCGIVRVSKPYSGYGNVVVVRHNNGLETVYAHNSRNFVKVGQEVEAGQPLGLIGRTGRATTEHLHFEVRVYGQAINPALLLDFENRSLRAGTMTIERKGTRIVAVTKNDNGQTIESETRSIPAAPDPAKTGAALAKAPLGGSPPAQASSGEAVYHTIVKGDTLSALAKKYGTTVASICKLSGISSTTVLQLGKKLRVN